MVEPKFNWASRVGVTVVVNLVEKSWGNICAVSDKVSGHAGGQAM